jgi:RNA polymerase sigma-70 factor (ECF subfamily)
MGADKTAEVSPSVRLAGRIGAGDPQAEVELFNLHRRGLSYLLRRLVGDPTQAEDLAQETFRIVIERVRSGELREPEKLAAFVRGTARNLVIAERRKRIRRGTDEALQSVPEPVEPSLDALGRVLQAEDRSRVRRLIGEMRSKRDSEVLFRFQVLEEAKEVICHDLQLSSQQFNLVLFRARKRFRQLVEQAEAKKPP